MTPVAEYQPDPPQCAIDAMIKLGSGPDPDFDPVMDDFVMESYQELRRRCTSDSLLSFVSLGQHRPWLYRLTFQTHGLARTADGDVMSIGRHVVAIRFLPDYLRTVDRYAMLCLVEPVQGIFHPNVSAQGRICVEIYPGEPLVAICQSLHDLFRWRLRQLDERDALNPAACAWGRQNIVLPIDDRPLFGKRVQLHWQAISVSSQEDPHDEESQGIARD